MVWLPSALEALPALTEAMGDHAFVVLDYDGTLSEIAARPELATIDASMREAVARVARRFPVAILSGRGLDDVAERVGLDELVYAGCHGLEMSGPGLRYRHPEAALHQTALDRAAERLERDLAPIEGAIVEHKGLAIAVHRRLVAPSRHRAVAAAVAEISAQHPRLKQKAGKMVDELVPDVDWDKGRALAWMRDSIGGDRAIVFLGDDRTDEDAFAILGERDAPIVVASEPRSTAARYQLPDTPAVREFLQRLAEA